MSKNTPRHKLKSINYKLIAIVGPTASGKTELAIKLAQKFNGEIVSADSRQVYRGMNIGTAKPEISGKPKISSSLKNRRKFIAMAINLRRFKGKLIQRVPHYLIDLIYPNQKFNVALYKKLAIKAIKDIQKRGKVPFLVGGTGLYIQAVVDNIDFPEVAPQWELRRELEKKSAKELFEIYQKLDPEGAKFIEKQNKRRLIRAIEVCKITGKPFYEQRKRGKPLFDVLQIGIKVDKENLRQKISQRVEKMFKMGLEKEVKKLAGKYGFDIPPMQTIGYQEWSSFAKATEDKLPSSLSPKEINIVKEKIKTHTLQFAKRQMTWFKRDPAPESSAWYGAGKRINWIKNYPEAPKKSLRDLTGQAEKLVREFLRVNDSD